MLTTLNSKLCSARTVETKKILGRLCTSFTTTSTSSLNRIIQSRATTSSSKACVRNRVDVKASNGFEAGERIEQESSLYLPLPSFALGTFFSLVTLLTLSTVDPASAAETSTHAEHVANYAVMGDLSAQEEFFSNLVRCFALKSVLL